MLSAVALESEKYLNENNMTPLAFNYDRPIKVNGFISLYCEIAADHYVFRLETKEENRYEELLACGGFSSIVKALRFCFSINHGYTASDDEEKVVLSLRSKMVGVAVYNNPEELDTISYFNVEKGYYTLLFFTHRPIVFLFFCYIVFIV
ncbi:hypothetical protein BDA99DRAFT_537597 [Phascolomyces articulosus]|uniref:Uncharacterized protein n=1 Tax=Phascolomyces articulosus TaxID=60185 RepID=A0AAD5PDG3_9FUNG|nr:hypothetical protein BDA99DRAFT_537597 [Phascolomyces articulosus]